MIVGAACGRPRAAADRPYMFQAVNIYPNIRASSASVIFPIASKSIAAM